LVEGCLEAMALPLFPPELFILIGVNVFVALSLLTSLFDGPFPMAVPYVCQIAALAGFGQIWVSYAFFFSFVEMRFWVSIFYLVVALINIIAVNLYLAVYKKLLSAAGVFLGAATIPTIFVSSLSVSAYINGLTISIPPLPIVPIELLYGVLATCVVILVLSISVSLEPGMLRKMAGIRRKRRFTPSLLNYSSNPKDDPKVNKKEEKGGENIGKAK